MLYEKEYMELINKRMTISQFNKFTNILASKHYRYIAKIDPLLRQYNDLIFNNLTFEDIEDYQRVNDENTYFNFDVIAYSPSDYVLCLTFIKNSDDTITLINVGVES